MKMNVEIEYFLDVGNTTINVCVKKITKINQ